MRIHILLTVTLLISSKSIFAQTAEFISLPSSGQIETRAACPSMDAGNVSLQTLMPNVNPSPANEVVLCHGQSIRVQHEGNFNVSEDPDPSTPAGIRYAVFTSRPTLTAVVNATELLGTAGLVTNAGAIIVASADAYGNFTAVNDGSFLAATGLTGPQTLWFAPITVHNINATQPNQFFENNDLCIQINSSSAFAITYLNKITYTHTMSSATDGSFSVGGGLPETNGSNYTVTITNNDTGVSTPLTGSGSTFNYSGIDASAGHQLTISDDQGCQQNYNISFLSGPPVITTIPEVQVEESSDFCVPITTKMFNDVGYFSFTLKWNPAIIEYDTIQGENPNLMGFHLSSFSEDRVDQGILTMLWLTSGATVNIPDDEVLFQICFKAKGQAGQSTPLTFEDLPTAINFGTLSLPLPYTTESGMVTIAPPSTMDFSYSGCADPAGISTLDINTFGGQPPYSYTLTGPTAQSGNSATHQFQLSGLAAGSYSLTLTDNDGGSVSKNITLNSSSFAFTTTVEDNNCTDLNPNGRIYLNGVDPTAYNIDWSHNGTTYYGQDTLKNIDSGNFTVTVTDQNNCSVTETGTVGDNKLNAIANITMPAACDNSLAGQVDITITGGMPGYRITGSGVDATTAGNHTMSFFNSDAFVISDINGCRVPLDFASIAMTQTFTIDTVFHTHIRCANPGSPIDSIGGRFRINVSSSIAGENFDPNTTEVYKDGVIFRKPYIPNATAGYIWLQDLEAGNYEIVIKGSCGTRAVDFEILDLRNSFLIDAVVAPIGCNGGDTGGIDLSMTPAKSTYEFAWDNGETMEDLINLGIGTYEVTVLDTESNCRMIRDFTIQEGLTYSKIETEIPCDPTAMVSVGVTISSTYQSISWDGGETTEIITVTSPGYYPFTIALADTACGSVRDSIYIGSLSGGVNILALNETIVNECNTPDAFISVDINVPLTDVDFSWDNGPQMNGKNDFRVYDDAIHNLKIFKDNCIALDTNFQVNFNSIIKIDSIVTDISCNGANDGEIEVITSGGPGAIFSYEWTHITGGPSTINYRNITSLPAGSYALQIIDQTPRTSSPCPAINLTFEVEEPAPLTVAVVPMDVQSPSCPGEEDGVIGLEMIGGTPGSLEVLYTYSGGSNTIDHLMITDAKASIYNIRLRDDRGCEATTTYELVEPEPVTFVIPPIEEPACAGHTTSVSVTSAMGGSNTMYQFAINGGIPSPLGSSIDINGGSHSITVFDANGCSATQDIVIRDPSPISVVFNSPDTIQVSLGESTDISARVTGENTITSYLWSPDDLNMLSMDNNVSFTAITNIPVTLTATDSRGCTGEGSLFVLVRKRRDIGIPNAFTPNGDGQNEMLTVVPGPGVQNIKSLSVFDKYGSLVWQKENINPSQAGVSGWDGIQNGKDANAGLYVFLVQVEFIDGEVVQRKEDVMLIK